MVNVHDYAHSLARALKESSEYRAYQQAKNRISARPAAERMVADFHQRQFELQALALQGKEPTAEQQEGLQRLFEIIQGDSEVRDFLMAEQRLGVVMTDIYRILGEAIDFKLPID